MQMIQKRLTLHETSKSKLKVAGSRNSIKSSFESSEVDKINLNIENINRKPSKRYSTQGD